MKKRYLVYLLTLFLFLLGAAGCGSQTTQKSPQGSNQDKATQINASYSTRPINVPAIVALDQKLFEKEFQKDGIDFKWHEIAAGPAQLEALASKSIDISTSLNYVSALVAKANGNDIKVIAGYSQFPKGIGIVARTDLNVKSIDGLKNKKIALQKGTMLHELLIKALEKNKMSVSDVEIIPMESTDAVAALLGRQIDAAILPEPLLSKAVGSGKGTLIQTAEGLISGQTFIVARTEFVRDNPNLIKRFLKTHEDSIKWAEQNKSDFYSIAGKQLNLDAKSVQALYPKFVFKTKIDSSDIEELKQSALFLQKNGFIKSSVNIDQLITGLVDTSFLSE